MSVADLVPNIALLSTLGAGVAALAMSIAPRPGSRGQKKSGKAAPKTEEPIERIDSFAGDANKYRLAFNDLMHGRVYMISLKKNLGVDDSLSDRQVSQPGLPNAKTAIELARTAFDVGLASLPGAKIESKKRSGN